VVGEGVYREIAPRKVVFDVAHEFDAVRVPAVRIGAVRAERRDLEWVAVAGRSDSAVRRPGAVHLETGFLQHALGFLPAGGGGNVVIVHRAAQQGVADASAHEP